MSEMSLSHEARKIFRVGVVVSAFIGFAAMAPMAEPKEATSFVSMPGPIIVPVRVIEKAPAAKQESRKIPSIVWRNVG